MKIGIFFGGQSREREISFAGGRTVYDNLNKELFEAIPIFVDSLGNLILLDWEYVYKGTIRDFYPPFSTLPETKHKFQIYIESLGKLNAEELENVISKVGRKLQAEDLPQLIDFAFLALHGPYGEDGNVQGLLEWLNIPYSGSGILPSAIGIDKSVQKQLMQQAGFPSPKNTIVSREQWFATNNKEELFENLIEELNLPLVIKAPHQGSSIGISILKEKNTEEFIKAMHNAFFVQAIKVDEWQANSESDKIAFIRSLTDLREGIGLPLVVGGEIIYHPETLLEYLNSATTDVLLENIHNEEAVLIESFIEGKEFSCIVIQDEEAQTIALPPTQIIKRTSLFDYRSKYLPGMSRKVTPIDLPTTQIEAIRTACVELFTALHFNVYARLDGFITESGEIFLNDPNTTSGMLPSSFFFHQAAEIGLNPSQFLTYLIRTSLAERIKTGKNTFDLKHLLNDLDQSVKELQTQETQKTKVGVFMGGFSSERHISVESGRNIFEKLSSSSKYEAFPIFLSGDESKHRLHILPINVMLKDNADDIKEKVYSTAPTHEIISKISEEAKAITAKYAGNPVRKPIEVSYEELTNKVDEVFIALHGRPGEDGAVQVELDKLNIPYNGSGVASSQVTINKFETNKTLREHGISVANHRLLGEVEWLADKEARLAEIEATLQFPLIAKPADDGCSSAVKKIDNKEELIAFINLMFRDKEELMAAEAQLLKLQANEEFPQKNAVLLEELILANGANHFLEITGGLLTRKAEDGSIVYEVFEPSEALASGDILSLEEKFLAGEGQNITPARFDRDINKQTKISKQVRTELEKVAKIMNIEGYARIDAFVRIFDEDNVETLIIEINSLPGMTPATCIFHQAAINEYKPYEFIDAILTYGQQKTN
ncbi:MAG: D-alanine--D-alanine ligase [Cytophagales bacterium]|nr:D-alanine--D-alanine ligase [Cytophagales bacterium]